MEYQWYPGHMTKARRMMEENIRLVDLVIELVDARIPLSSRNPDIDALSGSKSRVVLLCKADLADPVRTEKFVTWFREQGIQAVAVDAREKKSGEVVRRQIQEACREKIERDRARGIIGRPLRAMVAGIPNVGKSTFINSLAGRASTKTGNKPGVTRGKQWIRLDGGTELLDTPGILWPKFDNQETGMRLALAGAIREEILDKEELAVWLLDFLEKEYPGIVQEKYLQKTAEEGNVPNDPCMSSGETGPCAQEAGMQAGENRMYALLTEIAGARRLLKRGGEPDTERAAAMLIDDCRNGRIGRISLDRPQDAGSGSFGAGSPGNAGAASGTRKERKASAGKQKKERAAARSLKDTKRSACAEKAGRRDKGSRPAKERPDDKGGGNKGKKRGPHAGGDGTRRSDAGVRTGGRAQSGRDRSGMRNR